MDSVLEFLYPKFILFVVGFWSLVSTYFLHLLGYVTSFRRNGGCSKGISNDSQVVSTEAMEEKQEFFEVSSEENNWVDEMNDEKEFDTEAPEYSFTFKFPTFKEFIKNHKDISRLVEPSLYVNEKNFTENIDSNEVSSEPSEVDANSNVLNEGQALEFMEMLNDQRDNDLEDQECVVEKTIVDNSSEKKFEVVHEKEEIDTFSEDNLQKVDDVSVDSSADSNIDSFSSNSPCSPTIDLHLENGFLSDGDFELVFDEKVQKDSFLSENDFGVKSTNANGNKNTSTNGNCNGNGNGNDRTNKLESLWEHQELIDQLKMEIKKVRAIGLPTIFEECESSPKMMEDLKPWKIEELYQHDGNKMGEVHKFYKSYRERMRKFDIFSYQKMYAIGFLQLKDPIWSPSRSKSSIPEIATLFSQKGKKQEDDPTITFIKELQSDLEVVYVGQICLSWEILHWQYEKSLDIWESDARGVRRFNEIEGEFQQFQVLMQRFIEDEVFQGPRIQNYVKNRCVFRNLLQVPVIRDDHYSKNRKTKNEVVMDITSDALVEILEESIRIFWRFVRADKYKRQTPVDFQRPEDAQLFLDLQKDLQKKEKKLKEQLRSGNSILKKLRSCREDDETEDQVLYFFCQVDLKLVSRVLQMSRLTSDQLKWCCNKLSQISFVNRKIHVKPSFLLFPC